MVVGVFTGTFSPKRGFDVMVRSLAGVLVRAPTRFTGPISWIRSET